MAIAPIAMAASSCASAQDASTLFQPAEIAVNATEAELMESTRNLFVQDSMNIFRRFDKALTARMVTFYVDALALRSLSPIQLTATQQMILTGVGSGQIKLSAELPESRQYHLGGVTAATGIRLLILSYPDEAKVLERFATAGLEAPSFSDQGDGSRAALVLDPGGFPVQIVIRPGVPDHSDGGAAIAINVSDLDKSRAFYREFVGLDELDPVEDPLLGLTLYPYRHKETTVYLFKAGENLPADTGSAGIQYVVSDAALANAKGKKRGVAVETPLNTLRGFALTTVWLNDPDGVTNYYAQIGPDPAAGD